LEFKYLFIFCSSLFIFSLFVPVFSATNETGIHNNQNLFSDLSRNMTLPDFQENNDSDTNPDSGSINDQGQPQSDNQNNDSRKASN
jgi:hypothetical protein